MVVIDGRRGRGPRGQDAGHEKAGDNDGNTTEHEHIPTVSDHCVGVTVREPGPRRHATVRAAAANGPAAPPYCRSGGVTNGPAGAVPRGPPAGNAQRFAARELAHKCRSFGLSSSAPHHIYRIPLAHNGQPGG
ncbi:hypothetical protein HEK616_41660 [Streptomyces nigrescens]|uniref:Uncharacterized protein n=1 Tax=Streptomyces nigrescens TaxID=1920 RepID=A0ABN6QWW4_STRNI|nr:hypothetical protein HEK616_41660 [Streptomyces nigrescens]